MHISYLKKKKKKKLKCDNDITEIRGEKSGPSINV